MSGVLTATSELRTPDIVRIKNFMFLLLYKQLLRGKDIWSRGEDVGGYVVY